MTARTAALLVGLALALVSCGESEPVPPEKRISTNDIWKGMTRLVEKPKPLPPAADPPGWVIVPVPAPDPRPAAEAAPAKPAPAAKVAAKPKKAKRSTIGISVGGVPCKRVRQARTAARAEELAIFFGHLKPPVPADTRAQIEACFPKKKG